MKKITRLVSPSILISFSLAFAVESRATDTVNSALYDGLEWRKVGPWRGGRVTAVTGVPGNDRLYCMGATGGGVWKTGNAGISWQNISDEYFGVGTIGPMYRVPEMNSTPPST